MAIQFCHVILVVDFYNIDVRPLTVSGVRNELERVQSDIVVLPARLDHGSLFVLFYKSVCSHKLACPVSIATAFYLWPCANQLASANYRHLRDWGCGNAVANG